MSEDEFRFLSMRASGGHGWVMTCASHPQEVGKGFPGQLGCFSDDHLPGLTRLASEIRKNGSVSMLQIVHAGIRAPKDLIGSQTPVGPSDDEETGARALTLEEVHQMRDDHVAAALRAQKAGFDGVQVQLGHGYLLNQFLGAKHNTRTDEYGGSWENRARLGFEILEGIRAKAGAKFILGVRVSVNPLSLEEMVEMTKQMIAEEKIDFVDFSAWDVYSRPPDAPENDKPLLIEYLTKLPRGKGVAIGVAGKIYDIDDIAHCMKHGADYVSLGKASIIQHDLPKRIAASLGGGEPWEKPQLPKSADYFRSEGLGEPFIQFINNWKMVEDEKPPDEETMTVVRSRHNSA